MAIVAQLVRAPDCGSGGRGFKSRRSPTFYRDEAQPAWKRERFLSTLEIIILGIIQGLTEFLPVSSSGHLALGQRLLGFQDPSQYILFDLVCHLGTLAAIVGAFTVQIRQMATHERWRVLQLAVGTLPLFPLVLILKPIKSIYDTPQALGLCFLLTALLLWVGMNIKIAPKRRNSAHPWRDALVIGVMQALAVLPGVSRSGATVSTATFLGWKRSDAVVFSFMLAIPAILGATALEVLELTMKPETANIADMSNVQYLIAFVVSAVVGWLSLKLMIRLVMQKKLMVFVWYCLALGVGTLLFFNLDLIA